MEEICNTFSLNCNCKTELSHLIDMASQRSSVCFLKVIKDPKAHIAITVNDYNRPYLYLQEYAYGLAKYSTMINERKTKAD